MSGRDFAAAQTLIVDYSLNKSKTLELKNVENCDCFQISKGCDLVAFPPLKWTGWAG